jgi:hypothetical protein
VDESEGARSLARFDEAQVLRLTEKPPDGGLFEPR